jgi:hypothetical protein
MKIKISQLMKYLALAGSVTALSSCAVYPAGPGYGGGPGYGYVPYSVEIYGGHPYYDRGYHERRDWGDRGDRGERGERRH